MRAAVSVVAVLLLVFPPAAAGEWRIAAGGGIAWQDVDNHELDWEHPRFRAAADSFDSGPAAYIGIERRIARWLSVGGFYSYSLIKQKSRAKTYHRDYRPEYGLDREIDVDIHAAAAYARPSVEIVHGVEAFLRCGVGWLYVDSSQLGRPHGLFLHAGAGMEYRIDERWGLEVLAGYNKGRAWDGMPDVSDYRFGWSLILLTYRFSLYQ